MSRLSSLLGVGGVLLASATCQAFTWQAGLRERMFSLVQHPYGNDNALRVRRDVQDLGFHGITMNLRLQMNGATDSEVFVPPVRSRREHMETMLTSILQGRAEAILKPVIFKDPGFNVASRLTGINPARTDIWFDSYHQAVNSYTAIAIKREIAEIVVATGVGQMWKAEHAERWIEILQDVRRRVGASPRLSVELSDETDLAVMEQWAQQNPESFARFLAKLNLIRVSAAPVESRLGGGDWSASATSAIIADRLTRLAKIAPKTALALGNVTIPACRQRTVLEDEVACEPNARFDQGYQAAGFRAFFDALKLLPANLAAKLSSVEILEATTDREPDNWDFDPRFPYYNPSLPPLFKEELKRSYGQPATSRSPASAVPASDRKFSCVYFDAKDENDFTGQIHSRMLINLMGAFPTWKSEIRPLSRFKSGDLKSCDVLFYFGTNYGLETPKVFTDEIAEASRTKTVVWFNYKFSNFVESFERRGQKVGFNAKYFDQPLSNPSLVNEDPGFYRYFDYKGETFEKMAKWDVGANRFMSSPELALIEIAPGAGEVEILSSARHSLTQTVTPYVVRRRFGQGSIWYFADSPMSYVHYEDRYLILCDLMWDILQEKAPAGPLGALVRIEDVNPSQNSHDLRWAVDYLSSQKVPVALAVIPYYANTFGSDFTDRKPESRPVTEFKEFVGSLKYAVRQGASLVWHGVYHHAGDLLSGYDGSSGPDYEFWLYPENTPIPGDSSDFVLDQLERGEKIFQAIGTRPVAWEVPHYASSALDSILFGKLFDWNYHRSLYFWSDVEQDAPLKAEHKFFDCVTDACRQERRQLARELKVKVHSLQFAGQPVPFRVWKDYYGQALIPETLGMIDYPFYNDHTWRPISRPEDLLRRAKKLRAVRGSFASFFWHPDLVSSNLPYYKRHPGHYETEGGKNTLIRMVEGLKALGYEFKSVSDCSLFPGKACKAK